MNPEGVIEETKAKTAGMVVNTAELSQEILRTLFYIEELDQDIIYRIYGSPIKKEPTSLIMT